MSPSRKLTVLIVDDELTIATTLGTILGNAGYATLVAYSAESALEHLDGATPDLLISDVMLPGQNGVQLAIEVRKRFPNCKVLLFSGVASSALLLEEAKLSGYDFDFLTKPVHPSELLRTLESRF